MAKYVYLVFVLSGLFTGCMHAVPVNSDVRPGINYANKLPGTYAVCISPEFANYVQVVKATSTDRSMNGVVGANKYSFQIGPAATSAVTNALRAVADSVANFTRRPSSAEMTSIGLAGYFVPVVTDCQLETVYDTETQSYSSWAGITLELSFYDRSDSLRFSCASTHSSSSMRASFLESEAKGWGRAVEFVFKQISRDLAEQVSSSPEVKERAKASVETP